jgi:hypothetical protein
MHFNHIFKQIFLCPKIFWLKCLIYDKFFSLLMYLDHLKEILQGNLLKFFKKFANIFPA